MACNNNYKKPPFPVMSAHFAHTLDDMKEKYVDFHVIEITESTGTLSDEELEYITNSRMNPIDFNGKLFELTLIDKNSYKYINISEKQDTQEQAIITQLVLDIISGDYYTHVLNTDVEQEIENIRGEMDQVNTTVDSVKSDVAIMSEEISRKIEASIEPDEGNDNYTLKLHNN